MAASLVTQGRCAWWHPGRVSGHTVLQLPVPALEDWVVARTRHHDASFVSEDPRFGHAHVTALGPFDPAPSSETLAAVGEVAARTAPVTVTFARLAELPDGIIHLVPEPDVGLRRLTAALVAAFPGFPPYGGRFGPEVTPHVTLDAASPTVSLASTAALLGGLVPVRCRLDELQLAWWESHRCHVMHRWPLGGTGHGR